MAYTGNASHVEVLDSRDGRRQEGSGDTSYTEKLIVKDAADEDDLHAYIDDYVSGRKYIDKFGTRLSLTGRRYKTIGKDDTNKFTYSVTLEWGNYTIGKIGAPGGGNTPAPPPQPEDPIDGPAKDGRIGVDMRTENIHINWSEDGDWQSYPDVRSAGGSAYSPDFGGAIEWDGDEVRGTNTLVPTFTFTERHYVNNNAFVIWWRQWVEQLIGKTNNDVWRGFQPGEVLCLGLNGEQTTEGGGYDLRFEFGVRPAKTLEFPHPDPPLPPPSPQTFQVPLTGWEYVWAHYSIVSEDAGGGALKPIRPKLMGVYVHKIYKETSYQVHVPVGDWFF